MTNVAGKVELQPNVIITLFDADGNVKEQRIANTVTSAGKAGAADQILAAPTLAKPTHMAIGTGTPTGTALQTEVRRNALVSKDRTGAVVTMLANFIAGEGTGALTEAGIFDASSAGNMWVSASFSVVNKAAGDSLQISWALTYA